VIVELEEGTVLHPCPFCGGRAALKTENGRWFWVKCTNPDCGASPTANRDQRIVIDAWNQRR
jgi:Lar family restriction alleviation protein